MKINDQFKTALEKSIHDKCERNEQFHKNGNDVDYIATAALEILPKLLELYKKDLPPLAVLKAAENGDEGAIEAQANLIQTISIFTMGCAVNLCGAKNHAASQLFGISSQEQMNTVDDHISNLNQGASSTQVHG